ncbi:MAG: GDP-mannose 4,6-dehydratase [Nitrospinae bacterium]|nr:GDP-mannose 4,6-dehydratase [Nitrospinota bacterium]
MAKKALITGITGQDGSYLAELLLAKGYDVFGLIRRNSTITRERIDHLHEEYIGKTSKLQLLYGDLGDSTSLRSVIAKVEPDEIYNLAAQSHVRVSFDIPEYTVDVTGTGTLRLLDAIKDLNTKIRFYQASSSEMYGLVQEVPQSEKTPFYPRSPYAAAKVMSYWLTVNYRESYDMYAGNGILFNHESPRRGENFVTRKVTLGAAKIRKGLLKILSLGNLDAKRDWGFAGDYVEAMYLMLQQPKADDYVIATGETYTVRRLCEESFKNAGIIIEWTGNAENEKGIIKEIIDKDVTSSLKKGDVIIDINPKFYRPTEVDLLIGDPSKAKEKLGWTPKVNFEGLVKMMVDSDIASLS